MSEKLLEIQNQVRDGYAKDNPNCEKHQILFVGSSLMQFFPIDELQKDLHLSKKIYNRGVLGTETGDMLQYMDLLVYDLQPSVIYINIGTNDIAHGWSEEDIMNRYDQILKLIETNLPDTKIVMMAYYPVNEAKQQGRKHPRSNATINHFNDLAKALANQHHIEFINVNDGLMDDSGNLKDEYTEDGIHMIPDAYKVVLKNMMPYLERDSKI